jgi:hypothetical protein
MTLVVGKAKCFDRSFGKWCAQERAAILFAIRGE